MSGGVYHTPFGLGDHVILMADESLVMVVSAVSWRREAPEIEVTWVHSGDIRTKWLSPDLLTLAPDHLRRRA